MAVTLNELAKVQQNPLNKAVIMDLLRQSKVLQMAPIENVPGLKITSARWQTLPSSSTRAINGSYSETTGTLENVQETLHIYGGEINVDRVLSMDKTVVEDPLVTQTKMKVASIAAKFNTDFINNTHAIDPLGFVGLRERVANAPSRQTVNIEASAGVTTKVLASSATENTFLDGLHELLHVIGGSEAPGQCAFFMNEKTYLGIGKVLRRLSLLDTTQDNYGRIWKQFAGVNLVDIGLQYDQSTEIISNTLFGDSVGTEIYGVRWEGDDGFRVIQLEGTSTDPYDPTVNGEMQTKPSKMRRIDWAIGLENKGKYAVGKLNGFKMAAT
jgi:flavin-binding protein dodecin